MKTAQDIYEAYRIMPSLQRHQLRVAGVAKLVCDHCSEPVDSRSVILACLFHDMGNIIKSDLRVFPDFVEPEGLEYWNSVKDEYLAKYGPDEHRATIEITKEIGLPSAVSALIDLIGFLNLEKLRDSGSLEQKIVEYADARVGPRSVLTIRSRYEDIARRYAGRYHPDIPEEPGRLEQLTLACEAIERQIFEHCSITPEDINDSSVEPLFEELRTYVVT